MLRVLDWNVSGDGMGIRVLVDPMGDNEVLDTPLKSRIISTASINRADAVDIVSWEVHPEEIQADELSENLETALEVHPE